MNIRQCTDVLARFSDDIVVDLQSQYKITAPFIRALKAGCDYLETHSNRLHTFFFSW